MGKTRSDSEKIATLYAIAEAQRQVARCAKDVARKKGAYYGIESWGVNYERAFERLDSALAELEKSRNPDQLPPNHPGRRDPSPLLPARPLPGLREQLSHIFQLHDSILEAMGVDSGVLEQGNGVFVSVPGPVRVLYIDTKILSILTEAGSAATRLEKLLATAGADEQTEASSSSTVLRLESWDQLGIGITEKGGYMAFMPFPDTGAIVSLSQGVPLPLKGKKRWRVVLDCFARSEDGRTARKSDLLTGLGYIQRGKISENQARYEERLHEVKRASGKLTSAMADLGRRLREIISAPGQQPVFTAGMAVESYTAPFTTRVLLKGEDGTFRFVRG
jgi:hypothetical protein